MAHLEELLEGMREFVSGRIPSAKREPRMNEDQDDQFPLIWLPTFRLWALPYLLFL